MVACFRCVHEIDMRGLQRRFTSEITCNSVHTPYRISSIPIILGIILEWIPPAQGEANKVRLCGNMLGFSRLVYALSPQLRSCHRVWL